MWDPRRFTTLQASMAYHRDSSTFDILIDEERPPLWSSDQSSWIQIQRSGFDSRHYQIFWEVRGLEWDPLSLLSTIEELLGRNSTDLENREYGRGDPLRYPRDTLYPQQLALTSPASGGRSAGIIRSRTKATEFLIDGESRTYVAKLLAVK
jgi:hypothetical protein